MSNNTIVAVTSSHVRLTDRIISDLKNQVDILKSLLALSLPYVEEMASLTESPEDAYLAGQIKKELNND